MKSISRNPFWIAGQILFIVIIILAVAGIAAIGKEQESKNIPTMTTRSGKQFKNVKIIGHEGDIIKFMHSGGIEKVPIGDLPDDLRKPLSLKIINARKQKETQELIARAKRISPDALDEHKRICDKLLQLNPDNEHYKKQRDYYVERIRRRKQKWERASANQAKTSTSYSIVANNDLSFGFTATGERVVRKQYRVKVPGEMTKAQLTTISQQIIAKATSREKVHAISIFFYLPESYTQGVYTAGKAIWAPGGEWGDADKQYSHKLVVEAGKAIDFKGKRVTMPLKTKQKIFRALVEYQDQGKGDSKAYEVVAKRYRITTEQAKKIAKEGLEYGWPMPGDK